MFDPAMLLKSPLEKQIKSGSNYLANKAGKLKSAPGMFADSISVEIIESILKEEAPEKMEGSKYAMLPSYQLRGRKYILVNEWGPYDLNPQYFGHASGAKMVIGSLNSGPGWQMESKKAKRYQTGFPFRRHTRNADSKCSRQILS
jgi:hypothetical protein